MTSPASDIAPLPDVDAPEAITTLLGGPVGVCSRDRGTLAAGVRSHPLIAARHAAFRNHRPVRLSPAVIRLTPAQGFAATSTGRRGAAPTPVRHAGEPPVAVGRDDAGKGSPESLRPEAFSDLIRAHDGDETHTPGVADRSTTGTVERTVAAGAAGRCRRRAGICLRRAAGP